MRASLMTRAGSVAAAAAIATTGAMVTAGAADASTAHHHRLPTRLSIHKRWKPNHDVVIFGRLSTIHNIGLRGRLVFLDRLKGKDPVAIRHERAGAHGLVAFTVDPKSTVKFVLVFEGTKRLHSSHSRVIVVKG